MRRGDQIIINNQQTLQSKQMRQFAISTQILMLQIKHSVPCRHIKSSIDANNLQ